MINGDDKASLAAAFIAEFGGSPDAIGVAHGRANLIGDHTDYNDGFVLPTLLRQQTRVAIGFRDDDLIVGKSDDFGGDQRSLDSAMNGGWLDFVTGAITVLAPFGAKPVGVNVVVQSDVPSGGGVSSSAALELALLRALIAGQGLPKIPASDLARVAQKIEHDFIGTQCGIMDQMVCAAVQPGQAMLLDCRSLSYESIDLFSDHSFVVMHSGSSRKLSQGLYNQRLGECEDACKLMSVSKLRDASMGDIPPDMDDITTKRARHVITENQRVIDAAAALRRGDATQFGALMLASHQSLATDYDVSSPELDRLVDAQMNAGALGARLTGAGFGGCTVALCRTDGVDALVASISAACRDAYLVDYISN